MSEKDEVIEIKDGAWHYEEVTNKKFGFGLGSIVLLGMFLGSTIALLTIWAEIDKLDSNANIEQGYNPIIIDEKPELEPIPIERGTKKLPDYQTVLKSEEEISIPAGWKEVSGDYPDFIVHFGGRPQIQAFDDILNVLNCYEPETMWDRDMRNYVMEDMHRFHFNDYDFKITREGIEGKFRDYIYEITRDFCDLYKGVHFYQQHSFVLDLSVTPPKAHYNYIQGLEGVEGFQGSAIVREDRYLFVGVRLDAINCIFEVKGSDPKSLTVSPVYDLPSLFSPYRTSATVFQDKIHLVGEGNNGREHLIIDVDATPKWSDGKLSADSVTITSVTPGCRDRVLATLVPTSDGLYIAGGVPMNRYPSESCTAPKDIQPEYEKEAYRYRPGLDCDNPTPQDSQCLPLLTFRYRTDKCQWNHRCEKFTPQGTSLWRTMPDTERCNLRCGGLIEDAEECDGEDAHDADAECNGDEDANYSGGECEDFCGAGNFCCHSGHAGHQKGGYFQFNDNGHDHIGERTGSVNLKKWKSSVKTSPWYNFGQARASFANWEGDGSCTAQMRSEVPAGPYSVFMCLTQTDRPVSIPAMYKKTWLRYDIDSVNAYNIRDEMNHPGFNFHSNREVDQVYKRWWRMVPEEQVFVGNNRFRQDKYFRHWLNFKKHPHDGHVDQMVDYIELGQRDPKLLKTFPLPATDGIEDKIKSMIDNLYTFKKPTNDDWDHMQETGVPVVEKFENGEWEQHGFFYAVDKDSDYKDRNQYGNGLMYDLPMELKFNGNNPWRKLEVTQQRDVKNKWVVKNLGFWAPALGTNRIDERKHLWLAFYAYDHYANFGHSTFVSASGDSFLLGGCPNRVSGVDYIMGSQNIYKKSSGSDNFYLATNSDASNNKLKRQRCQAASITVGDSLWMFYGASNSYYDIYNTKRPGKLASQVAQYDDGEGTTFRNWTNFEQFLTAFNPRDSPISRDYVNNYHFNDEQVEIHYEMKNMDEHKEGAVVAGEQIYYNCSEFVRFEKDIRWLLGVSGHLTRANDDFIKNGGKNYESNELDGNTDLKHETCMHGHADRSEITREDRAFYDTGRREFSSTFEKDLGIEKPLEAHQEPEIWTPSGYHELIGDMNNELSISMIGGMIFKMNKN